MTQQEFTQRTNVLVTAEQYSHIEEQYYNTNMDKDEFCKWWVKMNLTATTKAMVDTINELRRELAEEKAKRVAEREHAADELSKVAQERNTYRTITAKVAEWANNYPNWLSNREGYAAGYRAGMMQAHDIVVDLLDGYKGCK